MSTLFNMNISQEEEVIVAGIIIDLADKNGHVNDEEILHELIHRSRYKDSYETVKRAVNKGYWNTCHAKDRFQRAKHMVYLTLTALFKETDPE